MSLVYNPHQNPSARTHALMHARSRSQADEQQAADPPLLSRPVPRARKLLPSGALRSAAAHARCWYSPTQTAATAVVVAAECKRGRNWNSGTNPQTVRAQHVHTPEFRKDTKVLIKKPAHCVRSRLRAPGAWNVPSHKSKVQSHLNIYFFRCSYFFVSVSADRWYLAPPKNRSTTAAIPIHFMVHSGLWNGIVVKIPGTRGLIHFPVVL